MTLEEQIEQAEKKLARLQKSPVARNTMLTAATAAHLRELNPEQLAG